MTIQEMDNQRMNLLFPGMLFSALGVLVWLLLANYMEMDKDIMEILHSPWVGLFMVVLFNMVGVLTVRISTWLNTQYILNAPKRWKVILMYTIVMVMFLPINYGFLVVAKLLSGTPQPFIFPNGGIRILIVVWFVEMIVLGLLLANRAMVQMFRFQQQATRMQEENMVARYAALQNQLNPHFLFNSFNTLVAEIEYNPQRAALFTRRLSDVYRYVLQGQKHKLVTLEEELAFASAYLYLHEVRLGGCIHCDMDISKEQREYCLPPLTLQLLLENVIKHNTISPTHPMRITFTVTDERLVVSNTLCPRTSTESTGIGLDNLSNRCRMTLGYDIQVIRTKNCFTVKIPLLYE